jgi:hypothetical protein
MMTESPAYAYYVPAFTGRDMGKAVKKVDKMIPNKLIENSKIPYAAEINRLGDKSRTRDIMMKFLSPEHSSRMEALDDLSKIKREGEQVLKTVKRDITKYTRYGRNALLGTAGTLALGGALYGLAKAKKKEAPNGASN